VTSAYYAVSPVVRTERVARPFIALVGNEADAFIERWLSWFADAAEGRLAKSGCRAPAEQVDHVIPLAKGGDQWDWDNLKSLRQPHHFAKTFRDGVYAPFDNVPDQS
jgi:5-methylcytosine-specific restriction endonuclease McrA